MGKASKGVRSTPRGAPSPTAFRSPSGFGAWLDRNHDKAKELWVRLDKTSAEAGLTYKQAVDEALRIDWIDGQRKSMDADHFLVRFTPRKAGSKWSTINIRRVAELKKAGRMKPPGLDAFAKRTKSAYSFESAPRPLDPAFERTLRDNPRAWKFFQAQVHSYRKVTSFWVMSAKQEATRERRLAQLVESCERYQFIPPLRWSTSAPKRPG